MLFLQGVCIFTIYFILEGGGGCLQCATVSNGFNYFFNICSDEECTDSPDIEDESWLASLVASSPSPVPDSNT